MIANRQTKVPCSKFTEWTEESRDAPSIVLLIKLFAQIMTNRTIAIIAFLAALWPLVVSPNVTKTVWYMFRYGDPKYMAWGMAISALIALWASRRMRRSFHVALIVAAILPLWYAMLMAADSGYRNCGDTADTGPIFFLVAGWVPGWGIVFLLMVLFQRIFPSPPVSPPPLPSHSKTSQAFPTNLSSEQGGAGQPATRSESK